MYFLSFISIVFLSFFSPSTEETTEAKLMFEVINHDAEHLNDLQLEIYDEQGLIASLSTKKLTAISLPKKEYEFKLYYCDEIYIMDTNVMQARHHIVFVVDEKQCQEPILLLK